MNLKTTFLPVSSVIFLWLGTTLQAFDVNVTNSITNIATRQKIYLRITLDPTEQGIFHDTLRFSVDVPSLSLNQWHASIQPKNIQQPGSKYPRPLYTESFLATLAISIDKSTAPQLETASLCVASFILTKEGKIKARTVTVPLSPLQPQTPTQLLSNQQLPSTDSKPVDLNSQHDTRLLPTQHLFNDFSIVDELAMLWYKLINLCLGFLRWHYLWIVYLSLLALYLLLRLKRHHHRLNFLVPLSPRWDIEVRRFCLAILVGITLYRLQDWLSAAWAWFTAAAFMMVVTCYYAAGVGKPKTFLEKLKLLIGFVCGMLVIPLMLKGFFVLHHDNIFELFGQEKKGSS